MAINIVGGYRADPGETALDLPLLAAVASSALDVPLPPRTLVLGEVGLQGELRGVANTEVGEFGGGAVDDEEFDVVGFVVS